MIRTPGRWSESVLSSLLNVSKDRKLALGAHFRKWRLGSGLKSDGLVLLPRSTLSLFGVGEAFKVCYDYNGRRF